MDTSIAIFGRQPALGLAELESLFGAADITPLGAHAALISNRYQNVPFSRLGGSVKVAQLLTTIPSTQWSDIETYLKKTIPDHLHYMPEGKLKLGISVYGQTVRPQRINASALSIKKVIKSSGKNVRIVPNKTADLNSAQVIHNQLTGELGWEFVCVITQKETFLGLTKYVQDIEAYAARDQARPKRDARVGMLPPKLAQTIINLINPSGGTTVLDPFCGTGVVLQEALLMGFDVYGTDIEPRMIEYSLENVDVWLRSIRDVHGTVRLQPADATSHTWAPPFDAIACETYLGRPFSNTPRPNVLQEVMQDVDTIHRKFLKNVASQTQKGLRLCLAIPAWHIGNSVKHLKMLDSLEELGYNRLRFKHVNTRDLIYRREGQIVGRELVVLERI
jgi:tRNA (guanine10-N2)-dimethyltransferase